LPGFPAAVTVQGMIIDGCWSFKFKASSAVTQLVR